MATLVPHVYPHLAPGFPPYAIGARLPRTALGRAAVAAHRPAESRAGSSRAGAVQRVPRAARPGAAAVGAHGLSRALALVATLPQLEYPRAWPAWAARRRAADVGAAGRAGRAAAGRRPGRARRAVDRAGSASTGCCARRSPGLARRARAGDRDLERARAGRRRSPCRANAVLVPWLSYSQTMPALRRGRLPRRPRDAGARARLRLPGRRLPGGRRHGRERRAGATGPALGVRLPRRLRDAARRAAAVRRALREPAAARARRARSPAGWPPTTAGRARSRSWKHGRMRELTLHARADRLSSRPS